MRKTLLVAVLLVAGVGSFYGARSAWAHCKSYYDKSAEKLISCNWRFFEGNYLTKAHDYTLHFIHDHAPDSFEVKAEGKQDSNCEMTCYPLFYPESFVDITSTAAEFKSPTRDAYISGGMCQYKAQATHRKTYQCFDGGGCSEFGEFGANDSDAPETTSAGSMKKGSAKSSAKAGGTKKGDRITSSFEQVEGNCNSDWYWDGCECAPISPIVVDIAGDGSDLTGIADGVSFDIGGDGQPEQLSWTAANSDDAWLFLDRNDNDAVDSMRELFGNFTPQPAPPQGEQKNGFLALAVYDRTENGGNGDRMINLSDAIFPSLRLWQDANHNGISEPHELHSLTSLNVTTLHLDYRESKRTDEHGNKFGYRAKVNDVKGEGAKVGRWAWDVFLRKE
ncbi:MAG TPA: hypothetical protein VIQ24_14520 [Pyrinomonadaceae bacterium]